MRIALSHPWCWPAVQRGGERLFADLATYLAGAGHELLTISAGPDASSAVTSSGARAVVLPVSHERAARWLRVDQSVTYLPAAARAVRRFDPDVFHGLYHLDGVLGRLAGCRRRIVHVQGMPRRAALAGRPIQRRLLTLSMREPTTVVAVSQAAAAVIESEFGFPARVLHNGVNTAPFREAEAQVDRGEAPSVLFPSSPTDARKRLGLLVEALGLLQQRWPGLHLVVAASAPAEVRQRVEAQSSVPVEWLSTSNPDAMPGVYARTWVTCAPAVREAFGLVFVEAMATGRPAVGVADGGVPEVVPDQRWLAEPDVPESLAAALEAALVDAQVHATVARCQGHAASFDWQVRGPAFESLYREVTDTVPGR